MTLLNMTWGGVGQGAFLDDRVDMAPSGMLRDSDTLQVMRFVASASLDKLWPTTRQHLGLCV